MKRLFLSSSFDGVTKKFIELLGKEANGLTVGFVPTAADPYEDRWWVENDRNALKNSGFIVTDIDLKNKTQQQLEKEFKDKDIIFVAGGNTFFLLQETLNSGFGEIIKNHLGQGKWYVGSSAGSILPGPSLEPIVTLDSPEAAAKLKSYNGLGLVDFVVLPHWENPAFEPKYRKGIYENYKDKFKLVKLKDNEAVVMDGDTMSTVSA